MINVWGSWYDPCRTETQEIEKHSSRPCRWGVQLVGIDACEGRQMTQDVVADRHVLYPFIFDHRRAG